MAENKSEDILITKYLAPEWRQVAMNLKGYFLNFSVSIEKRVVVALWFTV